MKNRIRSWKVTRTSNHVVHVGGPIFTVAYVLGEDLENPMECANLIAAAPEMLEVLRHIKEVVPDSLFRSPVHVMVRNAIAKATGGVE